MGGRDLSKFIGIDPRLTIEVAELADAAGLAAESDRILSAARSSIRLIPRQGGHPLTRLGGTASAPAGFEWPSWKGIPQSFLGQIAVHELPPEMAATLPAPGLLSFFYDSAQSTWGFDPHDRGSFRVYNFPDLEGLAELAPPEDLPDSARFNETGVDFRIELTLPSWDSIELEGLGLDRLPGFSAYVDLLEAVESLNRIAAGSSFEPIHRFLGNPDQIQNEMRVECELVTNGLYMGDATAFIDPRAQVLRAGAAAWRLLLQLDTDDHLGTMWGDGGRVYFWIRDDDLARGAFDSAWMILQCS